MVSLFISSQYHLPPHYMKLNTVPYNGEGLVKLTKKQDLRAHYPVHIRMQKSLDTCASSRALVADVPCVVGDNVGANPNPTIVFASKCKNPTLRCGSGNKANNIKFLVFSIQIMRTTHVLLFAIVTLAGLHSTHAGLDRGKEHGNSRFQCFPCLTLAAMKVGARPSLGGHWRWACLRQKPGMRKREEEGKILTPLACISTHASCAAASP